MYKGGKMIKIAEELYEELNKTKDVQKVVRFIKNYAPDEQSKIVNLIKRHHYEQIRGKLNESVDCFLDLIGQVEDQIKDHVYGK